jgi:hypothetical protein
MLEPPGPPPDIGCGNVGEMASYGGAASVSAVAGDWVLLLNEPPEGEYIGRPKADGMIPDCAVWFAELYVYEELPGKGQLPEGLYGAIPACEPCELPLLTPDESGLRPSLPVTPKGSVRRLIRGRRKKAEAKDGRTRLRQGKGEVNGGIGAMGSSEELSYLEHEYPRADLVEEDETEGVRQLPVCVQ